MAFKEKGDIVMLMEAAQLKKLNDLLHNIEVNLKDNIDSDTGRGEYLRECNNAHQKVSTLLAKCKTSNIGNVVSDVNDKSMEENKNVNVDAQDDMSDYLKRAINISMGHVGHWCQHNGWEGLLEYLKLEINAVYEKYINLQKRYTIAYQEEADGIIKDVTVESDVQELARDNQVEMKQHYGIPEFAIDIQEYVKCAINVSLQCAQNCYSRTRWISKIEAHIEMLKQVLEDKNDGNMQGMADHLSSYKKCMFEFAKNCQKGLIQADFTVYSTLLKKEHKQFSDMATNRKMNELGITGEFDGLTESQKLEVWCGIINESTSSAFESKSSGVASHCLLIEFIFGKGDDTIREFTQPTFHGANMPNGMRHAREIAAKKKNDKKKEDH